MTPASAAGGRAADGAGGPATRAGVDPPFESGQAARKKLAREVGWEILPSMQNRHDFDGGGPHPIDDAVRALDEFASVHAAGLGHLATGVWKLPCLAQPADDAPTTWSAYTGDARLMYSAIAPS